MFDFFKEFYYPNKKSEENIYKLGIKVLFHVLCGLLTFFFAKEIGYPIPTNIFSSEVIRMLFADYFLIVPILIYFILTFIFQTSVYLLGYIVLWSHLLWLTYLTHYGLIPSKKKNNAKDRMQFLLQRNENLHRDIIETSFLSYVSIKEDDRIVRAYLVRFFLALIICYHLIISEYYPNLKSIFIIIPIYIIFYIQCVYQGLILLKYHKDYFLGRLQRITKKKLAELN